MNQLIKLVMNSVSGYFGIDPTKFKNTQLVSEIEQAKQLVAKHNFSNAKMINEFLVMIEHHKESVVMNNHILVNAAILDHSKAYFYSLVYQFKKHFGDRITICYVDTDSFLMEIYVDDSWKELSQVKHNGKPVMDFSFLPRDHPYFSTDCKGTLGQLKDDNMSGVLKFIEEYVILTKKCYFLKFYYPNPTDRKGNKKLDKRKLKGIGRSFVKTCDEDAFKAALFNQTSKKVKTRNLRSKNFEIQSVNSDKLALSWVCNSRYLLGERGIKTLPFGTKILYETVYM